MLNVLCDLVQFFPTFFLLFALLIGRGSFLHPDLFLIQTCQEKLICLDGSSCSFAGSNSTFSSTTY